MVQSWLMVALNEEREFNTAICARVKELRMARGWTAKQMALALNVPADRYRKYERRSPLPAYLMQRFALITGVSIEFLVTGSHSN